MQQRLAQHGIIFLPFLRLSRAYSVAGVDFLPLRDEDGTTPAGLVAAAAAVEQILSGYIDRSGRRLDNCVVATIRAKGWDLDESYFGQVEWAASLLFLASWSCNEYFPRFGRSYVNSTQFRVIGQRYSGDVPNHIAISARRRDGHSLDGGYRHGEVTFNVPVQCSTREPVSVDELFLAALDSVSSRQGALIGRLRTALPFLQLANTDDDFMPLLAEAILMGSAYEQLLKANASGYRLTLKLGDLFQKFGSVSVKQAVMTRALIRMKPSPTDDWTWRLWRKRIEPAMPSHNLVRKIDGWLAKRAKAAQMEWWLHRKWVEELYDLRSKGLHTGDHGGRSWGWSLFEHLIIAAFVFPLAVKLLLTETGDYALSDEDEVRASALDRLLAATNWVEDDDGNEDGESWHGITSKVRRDLDWNRAWERVRRKHPRLFD